MISFDVVRFATLTSLGTENLTASVDLSALKMNKNKY
jgi:hypothetical protein